MEEAVRADTKQDAIVDLSLASIQRRALLSWLDQLERALGIEPRTSQLRRFWRDRGEPPVDE